LDEVTVSTFREYAETLSSDAVADRAAEIGPAVLRFLGEASRDDSMAGVRLPEGNGEHAGISDQVRGNGPPLVLLPLNLARSQLDHLVSVLASSNCTITMGGAFLVSCPS